MMKNSNLTPAGSLGDISDWKPIVARYQKPSVGRSVWQIANTLVPYAALWYLMYLSVGVSWWLAVPLAVLAGAFLVRAFIIFHDCGHGSFGWTLATPPAPRFALPDVWARIKGLPSDFRRLWSHTFWTVFSADSAAARSLTLLHPVILISPHCPHDPGSSLIVCSRSPFHFANPSPAFCVVLSVKLSATSLDWTCWG